MNQILNANYKKEKIKNFFKIQFIISIIFIIVGIIYLVKNIKKKEIENNISKIISINAKLNSVFAGNSSQNNSVYFGRIICEKIDLDYFVFKNYSEENLKMLPCKFSGGDFNDNTNICIIGHNYFDDRFFSNLNKLDVEDLIILKDLDENEYKYKIYKKYEIDDSEIEKFIKQEVDNELTLCTCTFEKNKRFIIRASLVKNV